MKTNTELLISDIFSDYDNQKVSFEETLKKLSKIHYHDRDLLNKELQVFLQEVDLMYEDYIEGLIDLDKSSFDISLDRIREL